MKKYTLALVFLLKIFSSHIFCVPKLRSHTFSSTLFKIFFTTLLQFNFATHKHQSISRNMMKQELFSCRFSNWYPTFEKLTIPSRIISLSSDFVAYLQHDGTLILPKGVEIGEASVEREETAWEDNTEDDDRPDFKDLISEIKKSITDLGGKVFPKLNWTSPRDAAWINNNTLQCTTPGEILLLMKGSDFVQHDLTSMMTKCDDVTEADDHSQELVLRKWANLSPGMEFRCFIRDKKLIGISQREWKQYFDFVEAAKEELTVEIQEFIAEKILHQFPSRNFTVDLYKKKNGKYWIIDFNPFHKVTDSLLFGWNELTQGQIDSSSTGVDIILDGCVTGQFRFADPKTTLQPSEYLSYRMPVDFLHLSTGTDATKLVDFMRMKIQGENDEDSSESGDDEQWCLPR